MRKATNPASAATFEKPPIPLVNIETGRKTKLRLRTTSLGRELEDLPADLRELNDMFITVRNHQNDGIYTMVVVWNKLRAYEKYWTSFGFESEPEYLAFYGHPDGRTLGQWSAIVEFFDKPTFVLVGVEALSYMMLAIHRYTTDVDRCKEDYRKIFENYCEKFNHFNKLAFLDTVEKYIARKYEKRATTKQVAVLAPGTRARRGLVAVTGRQEISPRVTQDLSWREEKCPACVAKIVTIQALLQYIAVLEEVIRREMSSERMPQRPQELKDLLREQALGKVSA